MLYNYNEIVTRLLQPLAYFHLSDLQGVLIASPGVPVHAISLNDTMAGEIPAIQVRVMTTPIPPCSFEFDCTIIFIISIIILVLGREFHPIMIGHTVPSIPRVLPNV